MKIVFSPAAFLIDIMEGSFSGYISCKIIVVDICLVVANVVDISLAVIQINVINLIFNVNRYRE